MGKFDFGHGNWLDSKSLKDVLSIPEEVLKCGLINPGQCMTQGEFHWPLEVLDIVQGAGIYTV